MASDLLDPVRLQSKLDVLPQLFDDDLLLLEFGYRRGPLGREQPGERMRSDRWRNRRVGRPADSDLGFSRRNRPNHQRKNQ